MANHLRRLGECWRYPTKTVPREFHDLIAQDCMTEIDATKTIARVIARYERGIYTLVEAGSQVLDCITAKNTADVYLSLPVNLQQYLISVVESAPTSDSEWETTEYFHVGCACYIPGYEPSVKSPDEERDAMQKWKQNHRQRVEALRQLLSKMQ